MRSRHAKAATSSVDPDSDPVFRREGEYWTVAYQGTICRLRDSKGLQCLALLLRQPGERLVAHDLLAMLRTPSAAVESVTARGPQVVEGGHARVLVTKHLKAAIRKIETHHPALGYHLTTTIRTGHACVYLPDPQRPVVANGYEQEFVYVYGAESPLEGELDWMICRKMNTERMSTRI